MRCLAHSRSLDGSCALREASQDLVRWDIVRWHELVPEAEFPPAALDEAVAVISSGSGCPALPRHLGAPLADEVAHFAVGKRQAHQPLELIKSNNDSTLSLGPSKAWKT